MKCETCRDLLTAYLKEELEKEERERLEEHLASCAECAKEAEGARKVLALVEQASDPAVVSLVNGLIHEGIKARASDIHIQGIADHASVRYRVDGVLHEVRDLDRNTQTAAVTRIKQMSGMNVAERRLPQDGRIHVLHEGKEYDLRVATVPAVLGETVVMRILDRGMLPVSLDQMGLRGETRQELEVLIHKPCGMLIVSGPTGSGKTTTLYALMQHLNDRKYHLMSVEDPVEFQIDGVTQIHINRKVGLDFV